MLASDLGTYPKGNREPRESFKGGRARLKWKVTRVKPAHNRLEVRMGEGGGLVQAAGCGVGSRVACQVRGREEAKLMLCLGGSR